MSGNIPTPWMTNVMGILGDCRVLFASILCPALSYYATSELFESPPAGVVESCIGGYCLCCGFILRTRLREKYNLDGSFLGDFVAHCCCHCVALARIWREAEMQMEAEKQYQQQHPPQQNIMQLPPQQNVMQVPMQPLQQQYLMHPSGRQPFIHPGLQPMNYVDPYQQHQIYMPQQAIMVQRPLDQQYTVDTNLSSDFDSRHDGMTGRETATSYNRNDSIERPPSNNDPDPWNMLPTLHAPNKQVSPKRRVEERTPESPGQQRKKVPEQRPERAGMSYEDYIAGEMGTVPAVKPQASPFSATRLPSDETAPKALILSERLANLRPGTSPKPTPQGHGNSGKLARDESDAADRILLGSADLVTKVSMSKEIETEETHHDSHEDPPQHMDRSGSLNTKPDDASLLTYGATVGSEINTSLVLPPAEPKKEKPDEPLLAVGRRSDQK